MDFPCCACGCDWDDWPTEGEGEDPAAGAPQIPALAFSLAILARFGPLPAGELDFWIPALALADDHSDPKTSPPPPAGLAAAGLLPAEEAEFSDETEDMPGLWPSAPPPAGCAELVATEVK